MTQQCTRRVFFLIIIFFLNYIFNKLSKQGMLKN